MSRPHCRYTQFKGLRFPFPSFSIDRILPKTKPPIWVVPSPSVKNSTSPCTPRICVSPAVPLGIRNVFGQLHWIMDKHEGFFWLKLYEITKWEFLYPLVIHGRNIRLISFDDFPMENPTQLPWNFPLKSPWIPIKQLQWCSKKNAWSSIQKNTSNEFPMEIPMIFPWFSHEMPQTTTSHRLTTVPRQWLAPASRVHRCPRRWWWSWRDDRPPLGTQKGQNVSDDYNIGNMGMDQYLFDIH